MEADFLMNRYYKLVNKSPVLVTSWEEMTIQWDGYPRVKAETIEGARISTIFLGEDHNWGDGPPLLFETKIIGGEYDGEMWRYSTWDEAEAGHAAAVDLVRRKTLVQNTALPLPCPSEKPDAKGSDLGADGLEPA
jgi:hypothetical protein